MKRMRYLRCSAARVLARLLLELAKLANGDGWSWGFPAFAV